MVVVVVAVVFVVVAVVVVVVVAVVLVMLLGGACPWEGARGMGFGITPTFVALAQTEGRCDVSSAAASKGYIMDWSGCALYGGSWSSDPQLGN